MTENNRRLPTDISPEEFEAMYRKYNTTPAGNTFYNRDKRCSCAMGIWLIDNGFDLRARHYNSCYDEIKSCGYSFKQSGNFTQGFDDIMSYGQPLREPDTIDYAHGVRVAQHLRKAFNV